MYISGELNVELLESVWVHFFTAQHNKADSGREELPYRVVLWITLHKLCFNKHCSPIQNDTFFLPGRFWSGAIVGHFFHNFPLKVMWLSEVKMFYLWSRFCPNDKRFFRPKNPNNYPPRCFSSSGLGLAPSPGRSPAQIHPSILFLKPWKASLDIWNSLIVALASLWPWGEIYT